VAIKNLQVDLEFSVKLTICILAALSSTQKYVRIWACYRIVVDGRSW